MPPRKIIPVTTKRLIASTFGFDSPQTPPVDNHKFSSQNELANSPNNKLKKSSSSFEESSWEKFKKKTQRKSLLWMWSSLFVGAWLVAITALYAIHIEKSHEKGMIKVIETHYDTFSCQNDTTCSAPTPYCDTRYSFQCSECISSSHCTDPVKKICDFYGTRACHECLVDRDCTGSAKRCDNTETRTCIECFDHTDCASNPINQFCYSQQCVICVDNTGCASQPVNKVCSSQTCVECIAHGDCSSHATNNYCSAQQCVQCVDNIGCISQAVNKVCSSNTCVQCVEYSDCASELVNNACSSSNVCVQCVTNSDCSSQLVDKVCTASNLCVQCVTNGDCASEPTNKVCTSSNVCVECNVHGDCASHATNNYCLAQQCVQCLDNTGCASVPGKNICSSNVCVRCTADSDCASEFVNKVCSADKTCVQCTLNVHCASNELCDLSTNTCAGPCTDALCESNTDGKTKCCGTKCIEPCAVGFVCNVFLSECVLMTVGTSKGTNVPNTTNLVTGCSHCHWTTQTMSGVMFDKANLSPINYLTGVKFIYKFSGPTTLKIENAAMYFQEARNCLISDFMTSPLISLGKYSLITSETVQFDNILPVTSKCFFILTNGTFKEDITCVASNQFNYQVMISGGVKGSAGHTPYYDLLGN